MVEILHHSRYFLPLELQHIVDPHVESRRSTFPQSTAGKSAQCALKLLAEGKPGWDVANRPRRSWRFFSILPPQNIPPPLPPALPTKWYLLRELNIYLYQVGGGVAGKRGWDHLKTHLCVIPRPGPCNAASAC